MPTSYNIDYVEKVDYVSPSGKIVSFDYIRSFCIGNTLRDYSWSEVKLGETIVKFTEGVCKWTMEVGVNAVDSNDNGATEIDDMMLIFNYDIRKAQPGQLRIYDQNKDIWYLKCFIQGSTKKHEYNWVQNINLKIISSYPWWTREYKRPYGKGNELVDDLDFPFDYPHDYQGPKSRTHLFIIGFDSNFNIEVYGRCVHPIIGIGDNYYDIDVTIEEGEKLVIDSVIQRVLLYKLDGRILNVFNKRNKLFDIFARLPQGLNEVINEDGTGFMVTVYDERREPPWPAD